MSVLSTTSRVRFAVACTVSVAVAGALAATWWQLNLDSDRMLGITIVEDDDGIVIDSLAPNGPGRQAGLESGDRVIRLDGSEVSDLDSFNRPWSVLERGRPTPVEVSRAGRSIEIAVRPGTAFPWLRFLAEATASLVHLALAVLVLATAPQDRRARLLFGLAAAIAIELALPRQLEAVSWWPAAAGIAFYLLTGLELGFELHLATEIPTRQPWSDRRWLRPTFYAAAAAVAAIGSLSVVARSFGAGRLADLGLAVEMNLDTFALNTWAVAVVAILLVQLRGATTGRHRHQARLVLFGVVPWAVYMVSVEILYQLGISTPSWLNLVQPIILVLYPLAFFVAMFHYHLFDLNFVLRRSLVFAIVTVCLAALSGMAFVAGRALFTSGVGSNDSSVVAFSAAMLAVGLLFAPLRRLTQTWVDRRLYPEQVELRAKLADIALRLPSAGSLPAMGRLLVQELASTLNLSTATVLVADPNSGVLVTLASSAVDLDTQLGQSLLLEPDDPGVRLLRRTGQPVPSDQMMAVSPTLGARMAAFSSEIAIGLLSGEVTVGMLLLGGKASGDRFYSEEMELLTLFSRTAATVLQNALMFESAKYESLTGLMRREAILEALDGELQRAIRYRRPLTVGMVDIDFFKSVNDRFGHLAGDAMLKQVARTLEDGLRASDRIGRYGGEEFLFFLPETELEGAQLVAEKLRSQIAAIRDVVEAEPDARVTVSIGLAELDHEQAGAASATALIDAADQSLLRAKRTGRNRVVPGPAAA